MIIYHGSENKIQNPELKKVILKTIMDADFIVHNRLNFQKNGRVKKTTDLQFFRKCYTTTKFSYSNGTRRLRNANLQ